MNETVFDLLRLIGAGVIGGLVGAFTAHKLTLSRERTSGRASRKREFLAFMRAWRVEVDRRYLEVGGFARNPNSFTDAVSSFSAAAELIRGDMSGDKLKKFKDLVAAVTSCSAGNFNNQEGHTKLIVTFDNLMEFVDGT